jgi:hypothetical protein
VTAYRASPNSARVELPEQFGHITVIAEPGADARDIEDSTHRPVLRNPTRWTRCSVAASASAVTIMATCDDTKVTAVRSRTRWLTPSRLSNPLR